MQCNSRTSGEERVNDLGMRMSYTRGDIGVDTCPKPPKSPNGWMICFSRGKGRAYIDLRYDIADACPCWLGRCHEVIHGEGVDDLGILTLG